MKKIYFLFFIFALLSNLSESIEVQKEAKSLSKLIGKVRIEVVEKAMLNLPNKGVTDILQMLTQMKKAKEENSLTNVDSAYLVYKWISVNCVINMPDGNEELTQVYKSGSGNSLGLSSLFNRMCSFLDLETDTINGYYKTINEDDLESPGYVDFSWNYLVIDGENYLIDVALGSIFERAGFDTPLKDAFFGNDPEIFIRFHFPKESKWQLLEEPYTFEKFQSMAFIFPFYYHFDIKSFSPDVNKLSGSGKITIECDESFDTTEVQAMTASLSSLNIDLNEVSVSDGKIEIKYNYDKDQDITFILFKPKNIDDLVPVLYYLVDRSKKPSKNLRRMSSFNSNNKIGNDLIRKVFKKVKLFPSKKEKKN